MLHLGLTLPPSRLWRLCLESVSTKFDCPNEKGSTTRQLQHLQYVQYGDLTLSTCFNNRTVPGLETCFELANQCFAHRHWTSLLLKQLFINVLNKALDSQFLCIHNLTKDSLDCLLTKQCKLKPMGKCSNFGCWNALHSRLVHPIHWGIISTEPAHLAHPRVQVRPAMQEFYGPAQCLEGTVSNLKPSKTRP